MRFLIDENLPAKIPAWNGPEFEFVSSLFPSQKDSDIWRYAKENDLTIVTKDSDFSYQILTSSPPPRVIHIKFGNARLRELIHLIERQWKNVEKLSATHKLVNVLADRIEAVN
ncbi:MAG: DUF5615 family PIN-like protein [Acidobacteria bacterium]|nr:DUF5615 family PIN-like protein [Acidobacteriota bacterium]